MRSVRRFLASGIVLVTAACARVAGAQVNTIHVGASVFLTRDAGWNFDNNLALSVGAERASSRLGVRGLLTARYFPRAEGYAAVFPPLPQSARNGLTGSLHGVLRAGSGGLYVLFGPEYYRILWETGPGAPSGGTWTAATGLGLRRRAWAIEGRYGAFGRTRGTSRGHLDVAVLRALRWGGA